MNHSPIALVLPVTDHCGGRCRMCGIWRAPARPDLDINVLDRIMSDGELSGSIAYVNITGGEPTCHPDLAGIAKILNHRCVSLRELTFSSNGFNPTACEQSCLSVRENIASHVKLIFALSLDGLGEHHDRIRGITGAFDRVTESLERIRKLTNRFDNMKVWLNCTFSFWNSSLLAETVAFARQRDVGITLTFACENSLYLRMPVHVSAPGTAITTAQQTANVLESIGSLANETHLGVTDHVYLRMVSSMLAGKERCFPCVFQSSGVFLDLDYMVYPCGTAAGCSYGSLLNDTFKQLYHGRHGDETRVCIRHKYCRTCLSNSYFGLADGVWLTALKDLRRRQHGI